MRRWLLWVKESFRSVIHYIRPQAAEPYNQIEEQDNELVEGMEEVVDGAGAAQAAQIDNPESISPFRVAASLGSLVFSKENLPGIVGGAVLTSLSTGINFLSPYLFAETLKLLANNEEETSRILGIECTRTVLISLLMTSYALAQVIPNLRDQIMVTVTNRNTKKIIEDCTSHLLKKSLNYHTNTPFPDQVYLIQKGFSVSSVGTPLLTQVGPTLVEISIACGVLSSRYGLKAGLGLLGLIASYTGYSAVTAKPIIRVREASLEAGNKSYEAFCNALAQYKIMSDFGKYDASVNEVSKAMNLMTQAYNKALIIPLQIDLGYYGISRGSMLIAALYIGLGVKSGQFTVEEFVFLFGYLNVLSSLLPAFGQAINQLFASYPDIKFVFNELYKPDEVVDLHPDVPLLIPMDVAPCIEFDNVSFGYPPKPGEEAVPPLFQNLSFKVFGGQKVALVSESGAGKTSIFNLLFGFYKPTSGTIKINNQDISEVSLKSLQDQITLFGQNPNLFKGTIRQNICYGAKHSDEVTDEMIWELARQANLYDFLNSFPKKLDTDVGEGGKQISGGQQQKVAILRALFKQSRIRLLDEITAPFDSKSAADILQSIDGSSQDTTTLMITHKLTEAQFVDMILVIDKGRVIASGTHKELLIHCELYKKLWAAYTEQESQDKASVASPSSSRKMLDALGGPGLTKSQYRDDVNSAPQNSMGKSLDVLKGKEEATEGQSENQSDSSGFSRKP